MGIFEGQLRVDKGDRFALVAARWNDFIVDRLIGGATDCLLRHGGSESQFDLIKVPGGFELPQTALLAAKSGKYSGILVLGCIIRGGTPHFDMIASEVTKGTAQVAMQTGVPTVFGVLTVDSVDQAIERAGTKMGNKGWEAASALIELVDLNRAFGEETLMGVRRRGREYALQMLYAMDMNGYLPDQVFAGFSAIQDLNRDAFYYARRLVDGVHGQLEEIDVVLQKYAEHWKIHRMAVVDWNLL